MDAETSPTSATARCCCCRPPRVLLVVVGVLMVVGLGAGVAWYQFGGKLRWSEPYRTAMARLHEDPEVRKELGEPIKDVSRLGLPGGSVRGGHANLTFKIAGPKGTAGVRVEARVLDGRWVVRALDVTLANGKRISVQTGSSGEGEAPKWTPSAPSTPQAPQEPAKAPSPASPGPELQFDLPDLGPGQPPPTPKKSP